MKLNERVIAISHYDEETVYSYGEGTLVERIKTDMEELSIPKILLDTGEIIYGYECWWGPLDKIKQDVYRNRKVLIIDKED